jgi:hypothetical protein
MDHQMYRAHVSLTHPTQTMGRFSIDYPRIPVPIVLYGAN